MSTEYDPVFPRRGGPQAADDLEAVRESFARAAGPYLASPVPWLVWGIALPGAALATRPVLAAAGARGVLLLWSLTILAAGTVEVGVYSRRRRRAPRSTLAGWALRWQGNLSLTAVLLSGALLAGGQGRLLPALWLLLLGHSLYGLGGLASRPLKSSGLIYQLGGLAALFLAARGDLVFAVTTALGNLWMAVALWRRR
jgi:hypothetical protein